MNILDNSFLSSLLTLAVTLLGLAVLVQIVQELYKYLRSSKGRAYQKALQDFLGPLATELIRPGVLPDIRTRGPFQMKRVRPQGIILPLKCEELVRALEKTAPSWVQRTLKQIKLEVESQADKPSVPSISWDELLNELSNAEQGTSGYWSAIQIAEFLKEWGFEWKGEFFDKSLGIKRVGDLSKNRREIDAKKLLLAFRKKFLPHIENAAENFSRLQSNFEYTYIRSNKRLTFIIALLITIVFNLPIDKLYLKSREVNPADAIKFAETTLEIYKNQKDTLLLKEDIEMAKKIMRNTLELQKNKQDTQYFIDFSAIPNPFTEEPKFFLYLLYCIITTVLITFGAPFWNDIASALLRLQKGTTSSKESPKKELNNG